jgi:hypothetical protein
MNARAEYGSAAHAAYKGGMTDPQAVENLQALLEAAEQEAAERYTLLTGARITADGSAASSPAEDVDRWARQPSCCVTPTLGRLGDRTLPRSLTQQPRASLDVPQGSRRTGCTFITSPHSSYGSLTLSPSSVSAPQSACHEERATVTGSVSVSRLWRQFDKNGDGCIEVNELQQVMQELGGGVSRLEVDELMALVDLDQNGLISLEEFNKFRCRLGLLTQLPRADEATWQQLQLRLGPAVSSSEPHLTEEHAVDGRPSRAQLEQAIRRANLPAVGVPRSLTEPAR